MRYKKLPKHKGIYQDTKNGKLYCQKRIKKKLYTQYCDSIKEAQHWYKNFSPDNPLFSKIEIEDFSNINGKKSASIAEVWNLYKEKHLQNLEETSQEVRIGCESFLAPIMENNIRFVTTQLIGQLIIKNKEDYLASGKTKRTKYDNELKTLRAMFNWWRENYDASFYCPVMKSHFAQGVLRKTTKKNTEKMSEEVLVMFLKEMYRIGTENNLYAMLAETQYLITSRIQEPSAITDEQINFMLESLVIDRAMAFTRRRENERYLKSTKTNSVKNIRIQGRLKEILLTLKNRGLKTVDFPVHLDGKKEIKKVRFLFHINGVPLSYRQVQYHYNKALISLGLYPRFTSTHIMRHASSNHVRKKFGIDHAQVAGDWKSVGIAEMYSGTENSYRDESIAYLESNVRAIH